MPLRLYNTFTKSEENFTSLHPGVVSMYTCGPTVYGRPHVGNYSSFLMADLLRRWLQVGHGFTVRHVKNITDVGHLLHDSDHGDDKIEKQAEKEKVHPLDIARRYTEEYLQDETALNMLEPSVRPKASETVPEMIVIIQELLKKGHAYELSDAIYFSIETFPAYGALSGNTLKDLSAGARVDVHEGKKHPADFALWKKCVGDNAQHVLRWSFPSGETITSVGEDSSAGFPGWHIECSAMSRKFLGPQVDIHTGGEDNIFPHHECEIAQSECTGPVPFARFWLHKRRIDMGAAKMSKSLGNILTLPDIVAKGYSAQDLRYYLLSVHYRTNLKFSWKGLDDAHKARRKIVEWMEEVQSDAIAEQGTDDGAALKTLQEFTDAMNSDLNTPAALGAVFEGMNAYRSRKPVAKKARDDYVRLLHLVQETFGCFASQQEGIPVPVQSLLDQRATARASKDFAASDRLRDQIRQHGYEVRDIGNDQVAKKL